MDGTSSDTGMDRVREALRRGRKIEAIKIYREARGVGLKDAKEAVERMAAEDAGDSSVAGHSAVRSSSGCGSVVLAAIGLLLLLTMVFVVGETNAADDASGNETERRENVAHGSPEAGPSEVAQAARPTVSR